MVAVFTALAAVVAFVLVALHLVSRSRVGSAGGAPGEPTLGEPATPGKTPGESAPGETPGDPAPSLPGLPVCSSDPKWPQTEDAAKKVWPTIEIATKKRLEAFKMSRSTASISGIPNDGWTAAKGPWWRWALEQSLGPAFALAKVTGGRCLWENDSDVSPMGQRLAVLRDDVAATLGDTP